MTTVPHAVHLEVTARAAPELIERVCRVLRHRGAAIDRLLVCADSPGYTRLDINARTLGDNDRLARQVRRLPDVRLVKWSEPPLAERQQAVHDPVSAGQVGARRPDPREPPDRAW